MRRLFCKTITLFSLLHIIKKSYINHKMTYDTADICQYTCLKAVFGLRNVLICHLLTSHFFYLVLWAKMRLIPHKVDTTSSGIRWSLKPNTTNNSAGLHVLLCTCVKGIKGSRVCVDACITHNFGEDKNLSYY